jgi:hypothetical protein
MSIANSTIPLSTPHEDETKVNGPSHPHESHAVSGPLSPNSKASRKNVRNKRLYQPVLCLCARCGEVFSAQNELGEHLKISPLCHIRSLSGANLAAEGHNEHSKLQYSEYPIANLLPRSIKARLQANLKPAKFERREPCSIEWDPWKYTEPRKELHELPLSDGSNLESKSQSVRLSQSQQSHSKTEICWCENCITRIVTKDMIRNIVPTRYTGFLDDPLVDSEELTDDTYMDWIISRCKKLFLILSDIGYPEHIFHLVNELIDDLDFPFDQTNISDLHLPTESHETKFLQRQLKYGIQSQGVNKHRYTMANHSLDLIDLIEEIREDPDNLTDFDYSYEHLRRPALQHTLLQAFRDKFENDSPKQPFIHEFTDIKFDVPFYRSKSPDCERAEVVIIDELDLMASPARVENSHNINTETTSGAGESLQAGFKATNIETQSTVLDTDLRKVLNKGLISSRDAPSLLKGLNYLQSKAQQFFEPKLEAGKQRIRWQCKCGYHSFDDFIEVIPGSLAKYEGSIRQRFHENRPSTSSSSLTETITKIFHFGKQRNESNDELQLPQHTNHTHQTLPSNTPNKSPNANHLLHLLLSLPYRRHGSKLHQPDLTAIQTDRAFYTTLSNRYKQTRGRVKTLLSFRTIKSIKFVQLEMYRSAVVDIRKVNDLPPATDSAYTFDPKPPDIIPPVGENLMLHLLAYPDDADEEVAICLSRIPKRNDLLTVSPVLGTGLGWGIHIVEGWSFGRFWMCGLALLIVASIAFFIAWCVLQRDVQGASSVAAFVLGLVAVLLGTVQVAVELEAL